MSVAAVTKLACAGCGCEIVQPSTGRPRRTCSDRCRQKVSRDRRSEFRDTPPRPRVELTFEQRRHIRAERSRIYLERLEEQEARARAELRAEWEAAA